MNSTVERNIFDGYLEKLAGVCDENNFVYTLQKDKAPIILTIKPDTSMDAQISMMEDDIGHNNRDSKIRFIFAQGKCSYKISEGFTISETTFNKLKNLAKKLQHAWLDVFFLDEMERRKHAGEMTGAEDDSGAEDSSLDDEDDTIAGMEDDGEDVAEDDGTEE